MRSTLTAVVVIAVMVLALIYFSASPAGPSKRYTSCVKWEVQVQEDAHNTVNRPLIETTCKKAEGR